MARSRLVFLLLLAAQLGACAEERTPPPERPNVVLLVADTTRADLLSAYGHWKPTSVNLERLASQGVLYERAFTTDFWTVPSHASLFTGKYPSEHQATSETNHLPEAADTLAERLSHAGYFTQGYVVNGWLTRDRGYAQGFQGYTWVREAQPDSADRSHPDERAMNQAVAFVHRQAADEQPFFLFVNLLRPHLPSQPSVDVLADLTPEARPADRISVLKQYTGGIGFVAGNARFDDFDFQMMRELYEAEVAMTDANVGELMDALEELGILDETLFIVTSDHGENIGEHGLIDHTLSMYESTIRVPLIIRYPKRFPPGTVERDLVSLVDVFPTVLDVTGLAGDDPELKAFSLANPQRSGRPFVIAENERPLNEIAMLARAFPDFDTSTINQPMRMIRDERHKLIWRPSGEVELYDLLADPNELHDLSNEQPEKVAELEARLRQWMADHPATTSPPPFKSRNEQALQQLRALGYVE